MFYAYENVADPVSGSLSFKDYVISYIQQLTCCLIFYAFISNLYDLFMQLSFAQFINQFIYISLLCYFFYSSAIFFMIKENGKPHNIYTEYSNNKQLFHRHKRGTSTGSTCSLHMRADKELVKFYKDKTGVCSQYMVVLFVFDHQSKCHSALRIIIFMNHI